MKRWLPFLFVAFLCSSACAEIGGLFTLPAGNDNEVQVNDGGVFGSSSTFTWNGTTVTAPAVSVSTAAVDEIRELDRIRWSDGTVQTSSPTSDVTSVTAGTGLTGGGTGAPTLYLASDSTCYVQNRETLQDGTTFYVNQGHANSLLVGATSAIDLSGVNTLSLFGGGTVMTIGYTDWTPTDSVDIGFVANYLSDFTPAAKFGYRPYDVGWGEASLDAGFHFTDNSGYEFFTVSRGGVYVLSTGTWRFFDRDNSNFVSLQASSTITGYNPKFTLPSSTGAAGTYWTNDGSGGIYHSSPTLTAYLLLTEAATTYLSITDAATTYVTQSSVTATYLSQSSAAATYATIAASGLSESSATATYLQIAAAASAYVSTTAITAYLSTTTAASQYLSTTTAASTYITQSSATVTYAHNVVMSTTSTLTTSNSATWVDATGHAVTITVSTGSRVRVTVNARGYVAAAGAGYATICRGTTELSGAADGYWVFGPGTGDGNFGVAINVVDTPPAGGTYTYKVQFRSSTPNVSIGSATSVSAMTAEEIK